MSDPAEPSQPDPDPAEGVDSPASVRPDGAARAAPGDSDRPPPGGPESAPAGEAADPAPGDDSGPVPRLPRDKSLRLSFPEIIRILMIATMLVAVVVLRQPCADSVGRFIESFEPPPDAGAGSARPEFPPGRYIPLPTDISEDELRRTLEDLSEPDAGAVDELVDAGVPSPRAP